MTRLPDTVRLQRERIAILAIFVGAITIAFAPILVRLSELGPMVLISPVFAGHPALLADCRHAAPAGHCGRRREAENPARFPADRYGGPLSRGRYHGVALLHSDDHGGKFDAAGQRRTRLCRTGWLVAVPYAGHRHLSDRAGHRDDGCAHSLAGQPVPQRGSFLRRPTGRADRRVLRGLPNVGRTPAESGSRPSRS